MLSVLSYFFWVAIALGILVFVHELGHFLFARLFGMRVDAFSLGFPPNIIAKQVGQTEYRLGAIPLGGYVKIAGMIDESLDVEYETRPVFGPDGEPVLDDDGRQLREPILDANGKPIPAEASEPEDDEYRAKPVWQRMLVISGGVIFNVIFAWMVYTGLNLAYGEPSTPLADVPFEVTDGSIAESLGLETGDRIVAVNGEAVDRVESLPPALISAGDDVQLAVVRGVDTLAIQGGVEQPMTQITRAQREAEEAGESPDFFSGFGLVPQRPTRITSVQTGSAAEEAGIQAGDRVLAVNGTPVVSWDEFTDRIQESAGSEIGLRVDREGTIETLTATPRASGDGFVLGVVSGENAFGGTVRDLGIGESMALGLVQTRDMVTLYFGFVGKLVTGRESFRENVGGPLIIAKQTKEAADMGGAAFWNLVAMLSIALAVFNILPIPVLDGGHLVFLLYEAIVRREPSVMVRLRVQQAGMIALLALMVFVIFNDAVRWFG